MGSRAFLNIPRGEGFSSLGSCDFKEVSSRAIWENVCPLIVLDCYKGNYDLWQSFCLSQ